MIRELGGRLILVFTLFGMLKGGEFYEISTLMGGLGFLFVFIYIWGVVFILGPIVCWKLETLG